MFEHRMSLSAEARREFVEIERTTKDGVAHVTLSCLAGLTEVAEPERYEHPRRGEVRYLHVFEDAQGHRWHVATRPEEGLVEWRHVRDREKRTIAEKQFVRKHELFSQESYFTRADLLASLGDPQTHQAMRDEVQARWERAVQAALDHGGVVERLARPGLVDYPAAHMDRTGYEAACRELGLAPATRQEILDGNLLDGEYTLASYSLDHIMYVGLARGYRPYAEREQQQDVQRRLDQVDAAHPGQAYTREEFEAACRTAGIDAPSDGEVEQILNPYVLTVAEGDPLVVALAKRRGRGMVTQARDEGHRCDECGRLIPGSGMAANLGLACSVSCYEAMAERPGRYASNHDA